MMDFTAYLLLAILSCFGLLLCLILFSDGDLTLMLKEKFGVPLGKFI